MSKIVLEVRNLEKHYGGLQAVRGVSFEVLEGQIFGLIGPNGAGKTTTFNMIAGSEIPTKGKIFLYNEDITGVVNENDKENENGNGVQPALALAISRSVCKMKMAVGAAPVMYGLPQVVNL